MEVLCQPLNLVVPAWLPRRTISFYMCACRTNTMPLRFLYFDLGKVLINFDTQRMIRQVAELCAVQPEAVMAAVVDSGLQRRYELGEISSQDFYEEFCQRIGSRPPYDALARAASDIFWLNLPMIPVVAQLAQAGYRMGILSNTCENHWEHCTRRFAILQDTFHPLVLSYRVGALKPDPKIYRAAAEAAGCRPEEIFFVDDTPGHVEGAQAAGFDAVVYTDAPTLVAELRKRGLRFNY